jgi:hypothetical protein
MIYYELNEKGLRIINLLYPYEKIKSFWVQIGMFDGRVQIKPLFFVKTERLFMPIISIPIENSMAEEIHSIMTSKNVPEEEMKEHISEKIMEFLGF